MKIRKDVNMKKIIVSIIVTIMICISYTGNSVYAISGGTDAPTTGGITFVGWKTYKDGKKFIYDIYGNYCSSGYCICKNANKMYRFDENGYVMYQSKNGQYINGIYYDKYGAVNASKINPNSKNFNSHSDFTYTTRWIEDSYGITFVDISNGTQWRPKNQSLKIDGKTYWFDDKGYVLTKKNGTRLRTGDYIITPPKTSPITHLNYNVKIYTKNANIKTTHFSSSYNKLYKANNISK